MSHATQQMRLGRFEFLAMNNPLRRFWQRRWEFPLFLRLLRRRGVDLRGRTIMDAGCGSGYSTELILRKLTPSCVIAFDFMPEQIRLAEKRGLGVDFKVGDATRMETEDATCDAVFIFGILHHIAAWPKALAESARVLKPGGVLLVEEPRYGFTWPEFEAGLTAAGLRLLERRRWWMLWRFRSYLCVKEPTAV